MKKHLTTLLVILLFIIGLSVLLYPTVSNYVNQKNASRAIDSYNAALADASQAELRSWFDAATAYNRSLFENPSAFYLPELIAGYNETLDITGTGIMGYIDIEKIKVHLPIYHGVDDVILQVAVGHLPGTSLPVGGQNTHTVLSGHRGLPSSRLFTDLDDLEEGDIFTITVLSQVITYQVDQIKIVLPSESDDLQIVPGKDYCTLITCTPYGINSHRMLVRGVRIDNIENEDGDRPMVFVPNDAMRIDPLIIIPIALVPMLLIMFLILLIFSSIRRLWKRLATKEVNDGNETN